MRTLWAGLLAVTLAAAPADDKAADPVVALKADYDMRLKSLNANFRKARGEAEQAKAREQTYSFITETAEKGYALAEKDPAGDRGRDAAVMVVSLPPVPKALPSFKKAINLLAQHHAASPAVVPAVRELATRPAPWAEPLLRKLSDQGTGPEIKGLATLALAHSVEDPAEQEKLYQRCATEFAAVQTEDGTVGALATKALSVNRKFGVGKPIPEVTGQDVAGKATKLSDYKGKVVVLDFWATWCPPCKAMIPHEREMVKKLAGKPFALISISADDEKSELTDFLKANEMPWVHWWNGDVGNLTKTWDIDHYPTIYVLDHKGVIRYKEIRGEELEEAVVKLIKEAEAK